MDKVDLTCLREASTLAARLALRIASEGDWPVARRNQDAVLELLDTPEYQVEREFWARVDAFYLQARQG